METKTEFLGKICHMFQIQYRENASESTEHYWHASWLFADELQENWFTN